MGWEVDSSGNFGSFAFVKVSIRNATTDKFLLAEFVAAPKDFDLADFLHIQY